MTAEPIAEAGTRVAGDRSPGAAARAGADARAEADLELQLAADEPARLRALQHLDLLDTEPEERFDRITRLAQRLFDVPMARINLIDADRQYAKSSQGLPERESSRRRDAFCDHTIRSDAPTIVPDATTDDRFRRNPFVVGRPGIRFYAGTPLHAGDGHRVGALCLVDTKARSFDAEQEELLAELGRWVEQEFAAREEQRRALAVQAVLQPVSHPELPGFRFAATSLAASAISGDLYDWRGRSGGAHVMVADAMGHGTAAAIMATNLRASLRTVANVLESGITDSDGPGEASFRRRMQIGLGEVIGVAAGAIGEYLDRADMFITLFAARIDPDGEVSSVDAGHGLTVFIRADGTTEHVTTTELPIGIGSSTWTVRHHRLEPGDAMVLFTDGLLELYGGRTGLAELEEVVRATADPQDWADAVAARARAQEPLPDDVTFVAVRRDR
jgi:serine phosphatase RsbU (regulator of sigma subunit)